MKCSCGGKTKVMNTRVSGKKLVRCRLCDVCGKKIKTIELDMVQYHNEVFSKNQVKRLMEVLV